ncbi:MAG: SH3 domain-containing protein [Spirochaetes bacterium]|jgi:hypothetical protein|nr:SH3 domain-containing protein [Spirochaetota bacterium]
MCTCIFEKSSTAPGKAGTEKAVIAKEGLRLRESPDQPSKAVDLIPFGERATVFQKSGRDIAISGATGKWCKIRWKGKNGWAFGGFPGRVEGASAGDISGTYMLEKHGFSHELVLFDADEFP